VNTGQDELERLRLEIERAKARLNHLERMLRRELERRERNK